MDRRMRIFNGLICTVLLAILSTQAPVFAKSASAPADRSDRQRYIVILDDPPLAAYDGRVLSTPERVTGSTRLPATANRFTGARKLDVKSPGSQQYLKFLNERFKSFRGEALLRLGRQLKPVHRYSNALNGFATELSAAEARALCDMPRVTSVRLDEIQHLLDDLQCGKFHLRSAEAPPPRSKWRLFSIRHPVLYAEKSRTDERDADR